MLISILCGISVAFIGCLSVSPRHLKLHQSSLIVGQIEAAVDTVIYKSIGPHTPMSCAFLCLFELNCRSFFHVEPIGHCQIHDVVLDVLKEPSLQTGSRYYVVNVQTGEC